MRSILAVLAICVAAGPALPESRTALEQVAINRNEKAAGVLRDGVLTLRLEIREGEWHPDGAGTPGIKVYAFGEEGKPLQVPGPLVRIPRGTQVRTTLRNRTPEKLFLHGFYDRSAATTPIELEPGAVREVGFTATVPGTFFYSALPSSEGDFVRRGLYTQLSGALIVDPPGRARQAERIMVLSVWGDSLANVQLDGRPVVLRFVINGESWPNTEALQYTVGDTIHWRVLNLSPAVHPMHLHGFYYRVKSRGTAVADTVYGPNEPPRMVVTERLAPGQTMTMSWVPERAGNWLFHCHDNPHIAANLPLPGATVAKAAGTHKMNHSRDLMGGLVMGIEVKPRPGTRTAATQSVKRRELRLIARVDTGGTQAEPRYGFVLEEGASAASAKPSLPGPPLLLKRGEPVRITVVNELPEATAIHWHGIELDSYYDGVADFAGAGKMIAPAIQPRDSFEVLFTPPRSGTFIYHTHVDEIRQQRAGLSGAILVLDPAATFDPATDITLLLSVPRNVADNAVILLNGTPTPAPLQLQAGQRYRLRVINIHTFRPSMRVELKQGTQFQTWRPVAKDGMDIPKERSIVGRAFVQMGNGETYDFEFIPAAAGEFRIEVLSAPGLLLATQPIVVK